MIILFLELYFGCFQIMSKYKRPAFGEKQVGRCPLSLPITVSKNLDVSVSVRFYTLLIGQKKEHDT